MQRTPASARRTALLGVVLAISFAGPADAATVRARVASVSDGDSVKLKLARATRAFTLAAVEAPEGDQCFAAQSKARLKRLLPKGSAVKAQTSGRKVQLTRGRTNVNRAMVRGGFARASGSKFAAEEAVAKAAGAGLWTACQQSTVPAPGQTPAPAPDPAPTPTPEPAPGDTTGQAAIDRMTAELQNGRWRTFSSTAQSSTEYRFDLCSDNTWLFRAESNVGGPVFAAGQPWRVTEGFIKADNSFRGAVVEGTITNADPPRESPTFRALLQVQVADGGEQWYWDGDPAQYFSNAANCLG